MCDVGVVRQRRVAAVKLAPTCTELAAVPDVSAAGASGATIYSVQRGGVALGALLAAGWQHGAAF